MTFRPSVLPDRDSDILSTFTRSFERARQLVRRDQADTRARRESEQLFTIRQQEIEDQEFAAAERRGRPGFFRTGDPGADRDPIASAFQVQADPTTGRVGEVPSPDTGVGGVGVQVEPGRRDPSDATQVGDTGFSFSENLRRRIEAEQLLEEQEAAEVSPAAERRSREGRLESRRVRGEDRETEAEEKQNLRSTANAFRAQFPEDLGDITDDQQVIVQGGLLAQQQLRATPTGAQTAAASTRRNQTRATILRNFVSDVREEGRRISGIDPIERRMAERRGETIGAAVDPTAIMQQQIRNSAAAGDITREEMDELLAEVPSLITEAGPVAEAPGEISESSLTREDLSFFRQSVGSLQTREEKEEALKSDGLDDRQIQQILSFQGG